MGQAAAPDLHAALLGRLRSELLEVVADVLTPRPVAVALVDFPMHENVGDLAIWAGELAVLEHLGIRVAYVCDVYSYRRERIERALGPDEPVLLHGGGNFGDLWPGFQAFRERVIRDFPQRRIVQLPQTVHYGSAGDLARSREVLTAHGGVTLLVRDEASADIAANGLGTPVRTCPDSALALRPAPPPPATQPVVWLRRRDHEAASARPVDAPAGIREVDWPGHWGFSALRAAGRVHGRGTARLPLIADRLDRAFERLYAKVADRRVALGLRMIAAGRVLVTDRLHGHMLACLIGRPNVIVDDGHGKVGGFLERWTLESPLVRRAGSHAEALDLALELAAGDLAVGSPAER